MILDIQHLYNRFLNNEFKAYLKENEMHKYIGELFHITPIDLGDIANLKPQVSKGCNLQIKENETIIHPQRKQKILYCGMDINVCLILAPDQVIKDIDKIFIYKSITEEIGYTEEFSIDDLREVYCFNVVMMKRIGYIDNTNNQLWNLRNYRSNMMLLDPKRTTEITNEYLIKASEYIVLNDGYTYDDIINGEL